MNRYLVSEIVKEDTGWYREDNYYQNQPLYQKIEYELNLKWEQGYKLVTSHMPDQNTCFLIFEERAQSNGS